MCATWRHVHKLVHQLEVWHPGCQEDFWEFAFAGTRITARPRITCCIPWHADLHGIILQHKTAHVFSKASSLCWWWLQVAAYIKQHFGFEYSMRGWIVLILLGFVVVFRVCAIIGVTKLTFVKR